mmetsp:Transcript_389/g.226  ORF Transcript_389/g.226 Transcript_389/m.226 type:complete len:102 (+) Transcript_389:882-1187(+)
MHLQGLKEIATLESITMKTLKDSEDIFGIMTIYMKGSFFKIKLMDGELKSGLIVICTVENGKMVRGKDLECIKSLMEKSILVFGKMIKNQGLGNCRQLQGK